MYPILPSNYYLSIFMAIKYTSPKPRVCSRFISQRYIILKVMKKNFLATMKNNDAGKHIIEFKSDRECLAIGNETRLNSFSCIDRYLRFV
jgi:hypothetical protein